VRNAAHSSLQLRSSDCCKEARASAAQAGGCMGRRVTVKALNCRRITLILEFVCSTVYMRTFFQASIDDISQAMWEVFIQISISHAFRPQLAQRSTQLHFQYRISLTNLLYTAPALGLEADRHKFFNICSYR
jgi:hypothetical protein